MIFSLLKLEWFHSFLLLLKLPVSFVQKNLKGKNTTGKNQGKSENCLEFHTQSVYYKASLGVHSCHQWLPMTCLSPERCLWALFPLEPMERLKKMRSLKGRLGFLSPFQLHGPAPWIASNIVRRGGPADAMPVVLGSRGIREGFCICQE